MISRRLFFQALRRYSGPSEVEIPRVHPLLLERAAAMQTEFAALERQIAGGNFDQEASKRFSSLAGVLEHYSTYKRDIENVESLTQISDPELLDEVQLELLHLLPALQSTAKALEKRLLPPTSHADAACILELRPGVGGLEAALFTRDLSEMYRGFAGHRKWPLQVLLEHTGSSGLVNEVILGVDAPGAFDVLRHESGVHRVQRVPATETKGRVHTSTAAVVVLPKVSAGTEQSLAADERHFAPGEVRVDTMRAGGKGGQHVNTTDLAVRLVHVPTGLMVVQQDERSQPKNKAKAFSILRARLAALERDRHAAEQRRLRTDQVASTDRSDKIRTYNYPQNRVTDHRCNYSVHDVAGCMDGLRLGELIARVADAEVAERIRALE